MALFQFRQRPFSWTSEMLMSESPHLSLIFCLWLVLLLGPFLAVTTQLPSSLHFFPSSLPSLSFSGHLLSAKHSHWYSFSCIHQNSSVVNDGNLSWACLRKMSVIEDSWIIHRTKEVITTKFGKENQIGFDIFRYWNQRLENYQNSLVLPVFLCILTSFSSWRLSSFYMWGIWLLAALGSLLLSFAIREERAFFHIQRKSLWGTLPPLEPNIMARWGYCD